MAVRKDQYLVFWARDGQTDRGLIARAHDAVRDAEETIESLSSDERETCFVFKGRSLKHTSIDYTQYIETRIQDE